MSHRRFRQQKGKVLTLLFFFLVAGPQAGFSAVDAETDTATVQQAQTAGGGTKTQLVEVGPVRAGTVEEEADNSDEWSPWRVSFLQVASRDLTGFTEGGARLETYNFLSFSYYLGNGRSLAVRPQFFFNGPGENYFGEMQSAELEVGDIYVQYSRYDVALLPGDIGVSLKGRLYLPNSEYSQRTQMITQFRGQMEFERPIGNGQFVFYELEPKYYLQTQRGYVNEFGSSLKANKKYEIEQKLEYFNKLTQSLDVSQSVTFEHSWSYAVPKAGISAELDKTLRLQSSVGYDLGAISLEVGLENEVRFDDEDERVQLLRHEDMAASFVSYVRF